MTLAQIIAAIASQITSQTADNSITPAIVGNLLTEITNQLPQQYKKVDVDDYTVISTDYVLSVNYGAANMQLVLPDPATCLGKIYVIKRYDATSTGVIRIKSAAVLALDIQSKTNGTFNGDWDLADLWGSHLSHVMYQSNGVAWEAIQ